MIKQMKTWKSLELSVQVNTKVTLKIQIVCHSGWWLASTIRVFISPFLFVLLYFSQLPFSFPFQISPEKIIYSILFSSQLLEACKM